MSYSFILDSNTIDRVSVSKMEEAGIVDACKSGRFNFYMTHPLLRECFHFVVTGQALPRETAEYIAFLTKIKTEPEKDENASDDIEHITYLLYVDGIVSNEKRGFMSNAGRLFPEKEILTVDDFCEKISACLN